MCAQHENNLVAGDDLPVNIPPDVADAVDAYAAQSGESQSAAAQSLLTRGLSAMLTRQIPVSANGSSTKTSVLMPGGESQSLDAEFVSCMVLPRVAEDLCGSPLWLSVCPLDVLRDMAGVILRASAGLGTSELPWDTLLSVSRILAGNPSAPWMTGGERRGRTLGELERNIAGLRATCSGDSSRPEDWQGLAGAAASRMVLTVCDVCGCSPKGPLAMLELLLCSSEAADSHELDPQAQGLFDRAGESLAKLLNLGEEEIGQLQETVSTISESPLFAASSSTIPDAHAATQILALASLAQRMPEPTVTKAVSRQATSEHNPSGQNEMTLTPRQARVLTCLRRQPTPSAARIAAELGVSKSTILNTCRELAKLGLAKKSGQRWVAG